MSTTPPGSPASPIESRVASRVIVCIDEHSKTPMLLRAGQRRARELGCPWTALHVDTPFQQRLDQEASERRTRYFALAEQMGGVVERIDATCIHRGLLGYLEKAAAGTDSLEVFIGSTIAEGWRHLLKTGLGNRLAARLRHKARVHVVPLSNEAHVMRWWSRDRFHQMRGIDLLGAIAAVGVALLLTEALDGLLAQQGHEAGGYDVPAIFLVACMFAAARIGFMAGLVATGLGTLCIIHHYAGGGEKIHFDRISDIVNTLLFAGAGMMITLFGSHARASAEGAYRREKRTQALFKINRLTANAQSREEALGTLHDTLTSLLEMEVAYFLPPALNPDAIAAAYPAGVEIDAETLEALEVCWKEAVVSGAGTAYGRHIEWRFEPLVTPSGEIGVMGIRLPQRKRQLDSSFARLIGTLADHSAAIIERVEGARMMEASRIREEREKLRSMLLSSVSHDLKTPLASVIGSLSVYHSMRETLPEERQRMLTQTALDEAQRLDSFISNILDMTRLESGEMTAKIEWAEPLDLVLRVKKRMRQKLRRHRIEILPFTEPVEVQMDVMLTEQVLHNLLDNAVKYAPADSEITIGMQAGADGFRYVLRDHGPGIPIGKEDTVFDKYSRLKHEDSQVAGTGLGLAISRAIMETQNGTVTVENHPQGGAVFTIHFRNIRIIDKVAAIL